MPVQSASFDPAPRPIRRQQFAALAALLALTGCAGSPGTDSTPAQGPASVGWHGIEPDPVPARPQFELTDTTGAPYDFGTRTHGRPTLLFFGYTDCPDECPTAMADIATALRRVPAALRERVTVVFVTTDPARDGTARLRTWLAGFDPTFVGLTGTAEQVTAAQRAAGARPARPGSPVPTASGNPSQHADSAGTAPHGHDRPLGYAVEHTNVIFAYDVEDRLPVLYRSGTTAADLAADLPLLAMPARDRPAR